PSSVATAGRSPRSRIWLSARPTRRRRAFKSCTSWPGTASAKSSKPRSPPIANWPAPAADGPRVNGAGARILGFIALLRGPVSDATRRHRRRRAPSSSQPLKNNQASRWRARAVGLARGRSSVAGERLHEFEDGRIVRGERLREARLERGVLLATFGGQEPAERDVQV